MSCRGVVGGCGREGLGLSFSDQYSCGAGGKHVAPGMDWSRRAGCVGEGLVAKVGKMEQNGRSPSLVGLSAQLRMKKGLEPLEARQYKHLIPANFQRVLCGGGFGTQLVLCWGLGRGTHRSSTESERRCRLKADTVLPSDPFIL